jgi:hypothetical protein
VAWYQTRTESELVELARDGDRRARATLVDRTIRPAAAVALHLTAGDRETAIPALITAYRLAFKRLHRLEDPGRFTHWLLRLIDDRAPFPVGLPADSEILTSAERDRVRRAVGVQTEVARRMARPAVVLATVAIVALLVALGSATLPSVQIADDPMAEAPGTTGTTGGGVVTDAPSGSPTMQDGREPAVASSHEPSEPVSEADVTASESESTGPGTAEDAAGDEGGADDGTGDDGLAETR